MVADCVCLMGLGWGESVPVDTHVWQIAQRDYKFGKKAKTFNKAMYDAVGEHFRTLWGKYAGWAHSVLFTADLRQFSDRATTVKEEAVQIKQEIVEPELSSITKKRKAVVATEVKQEIKVEETVDGKLIKAEATTKRRRTRARP
jgi:N-glycosylase/DNA lyase